MRLDCTGAVRGQEKEPEASVRQAIQAGKRQVTHRRIILEGQRSDI
jgi:hypothetical protein